MDKVVTEYGSKEYKYDYGERTKRYTPRQVKCISYRCAACQETKNFALHCWCGDFCTKCAVLHDDAHVVTLTQSVLLTLAECNELLNGVQPKAKPKAARRPKAGKVTKQEAGRKRSSARASGNSDSIQERDLTASRCQARQERSRKKARCRRSLRPSLRARKKKHGAAL